MLKIGSNTVYFKSGESLLDRLNKFVGLFESWDAYRFRNGLFGGLRIVDGIKEESSKGIIARGGGDRMEVLGLKLFVMSR